MKELPKLENLISEHSKEESRTILKRFYDEHYQDGSYNPYNGKHVWEKILDMRPKFTKALDVGCGNGKGMALALKRGFNVWGIDVADASQRWKENGVLERCRVASAANIPFPDNSFDFVLSADVFEHIPEWDIPQVLSEIYRVASRVVLFVVCLDYERHLISDTFSHVTVKSADWWLRKFQEAGFSDPVETVDGYHIACWLRKIVKQ